MECIHRFQVDSQNIGTCSLCGEVRQFPYDKREPVRVLQKGNPGVNQVPSSQKSQKEETMKHHLLRNRHKYYEDNKNAIIAHLLSIGKAATREKWNIPKGTLGKLMSRWLTKEQKAAIPTEGQSAQEASPHPSTNSTPSNGRLPPFPQFSNAWEPEVQLQWFEVYETLATRQHSR